MKNQKAEQAYKIREYQVKNLLKEITAKVKIAGKDKNKHWGHVGSMAHVAEELKEIANFLN